MLNLITTTTIIVVEEIIAILNSRYMFKNVLIATNKNKEKIRMLLILNSLNLSRRKTSLLNLFAIGTVCDS